MGTIISAATATAASMHKLHHSSLLSRHRLNHRLELLLSEDLKALILCYLRELDIVLIKLLLHDLLQHLERQCLGLGERHGLVESVLQRLLRRVGAGADRFRVVADKGA